MVDIHHHGEADAPLQVAFAYLDDCRNATEWMFGLQKFVPAGDKEASASVNHGTGPSATASPVAPSKTATNTGNVQLSSLG